MGMTITQKILAVHSGQPVVRPGDIITIQLDLVLGNDVTAPLAIKELIKHDIKMPTPEIAKKIALVPDHFTPNKDVNSAAQCQLMREFALNVKVGHYWEVGRAGIEHALLPEAGIVLPGDVVVGGDSHTCTYGALGAFAMGIGSSDLAAAMVLGETWVRVPETVRIVFNGALPPWVGGKDLILRTLAEIGTDGALGQSMEFTGRVMDSLSMEDRLTITNMAIEAGAANGIIQPDEVTKKYLQPKTNREGTYHLSDPDAQYETTHTIDISALEPQVAAPHSPGNVVSVNELAGTKVDQVFIGSCTNGRIGDLRAAADILQGKKVASLVRMLVCPATPNIYREALKEGLIDIFIHSGGAVLPPSCGPCFGGHLGILAKGETCLSTTNRNFRGRMGHPESKVYLANPVVAAASAIRGEISHPSKVI